MTRGINEPLLEAVHVQKPEAVWEAGIVKLMEMDDEAKKMKKQQDDGVAEEQIVAVRVDKPECSIDACLERLFCPSADKNVTQESSKTME